MPEKLGHVSWKRWSAVDLFSLFMIAALGLLIYFMFRNSRKQRQAQQDLQENLIPGAEVMTSFGLFATVMSIDDETNVATIDAGSGTVLRVHRQVLTKIVQDEPEALEEPAESSADDAGRESRDS
jgi:preprotein translocase subunit YajC